MSSTSHILMIRPVNFAFNAETAVNNAFQSNTTDLTTQERALAEFDNFVTALRQEGIDVTVVQDTPDPHTPDSIFPNNWVSFHSDGTVLLYPMFAVNRRAERKDHVLVKLGERFNIGKKIDLTALEADDIFLEGTGSLVLDRDNRIAYACLSPRTHRAALEKFCAQMNYREVSFTATDGKKREIYHTNVMMCVADKYVVICLESIPLPEERQRVIDSIVHSGKKTVPITLEQMEHFAGNMLQVENGSGEKILVMSTQAYEFLSTEQQQELAAYNRILHAPLFTIETNGGGSARCMIAEVFLPLQ